MNMPDVLRDILTLAVHAPSGDNSQPWKFKIDGASITLFNVPEGDQTLYNHRQRGSYVSHGAVIENICIAAAQMGLISEVFLFPNERDATARIVFTQGIIKEQPLLSSITKRVTNRKPYTKKIISHFDINQLKDEATYGGFELRVVEEREELERLADTLSLNERLLMEHKELHDFLFGMIRWTEKEELQKPGLHVRTMEFPAPVRFQLRYILKYWPAVQALNRIGFSKAIAKQSAGLYKTSSAFGAIIIKDNSDASYIEGGRALQRVWLKATSLGLSMQPTTALPYLAGRVEAGETKSLSNEHIDSITRAYEHITEAFSLEGTEKIALLFRLGYGKEPSAQSLKLPPVIIH